MRYHALALDYDGTVAHHGQVAPATVQALRRVKASGRKLILVTGRELEDLKIVFPEWAVFDRIVVENGGVLFRPDLREITALGPPPPEALIEALRNRGVTPLSKGLVIIATWEPHQAAALEAIRDLGLEYQVIFNKGAVMILPSGVNKATGLREALADLGLSPRNVVAAGDAENDHAMLESCECAVATVNALPSLKAKADLVTQGVNGEGVAELIERLLASDLADVARVRQRHAIELGRLMDGKPALLDPYSRGVLLAGTSGGGKTTFAAAFLEALREAGYQFCVFDPEGDYQSLDGAVALGDPRHAPVTEEALQLLERPDENVIVCTLAIPFADRPEFFQTLFPPILELRSRTGRPHWIVVDEAHHLLPTLRSPALLNVPRDLRGLFLITLEPEHVSHTALEQVEWIVAVGDNAGGLIVRFAKTLGLPPPAIPEGPLAPGEALAWCRDGGEAPFRLRCRTPRSERRRHLRKYSEGELGPDKHFRFRGPGDRLNLRAQNLMVFLQMADGVDDATWEHHRKRGDYSEWFARAIKDQALADEARAVETREDVSPAESRAAIRAFIEKRYTGPA
jgi:hydroxymethylpyrimidine pyrophosphatase-like HAD family hydrolase